MTPILLKDIFPIDNPQDYKVHFATNNGESEPLDRWVHDTAEWQGWQEWRPDHDEFNLPFIFSLMRVYPERKDDVWLFGGVFRVVTRHRDRYEVERTHQGERFIGRLKLRSPGRAQREIRVHLKNHYDSLEVAEILPVEAVENREAYWKRVLSG